MGVSHEQQPFGENADGAGEAGGVLRALFRVGLSMTDTAPQTALFEDDYLLRELGQVAHVPQVALTELVANAWDAGATEVDLILPAEICGTLTITDDGHGMTPAQFKKAMDDAALRP